MICPKCKEQGKKSTIHGGLGMVTTLIAFVPFYDEEGLYHSHDRNGQSSTYTCSNGHRITVSSVPMCPSCKWGHDSKKIEVEESNISMLVAALDPKGTMGTNND